MCVCVSLGGTPSIYLNPICCFYCLPEPFFLPLLLSNSSSFFFLSAFALFYGLLFSEYIYFVFGRFMMYLERKESRDTSKMNTKSNVYVKKIKFIFCALRFGNKCEQNIFSSECFALLFARWAIHEHINDQSDL